jgi:hypothetical protein
MARDRGCAMPGCAEHRAWKLHVHHIWHWADGEPTCLDNLVLLCKAHHHTLQHGAFTITASGGRFVFSDETGAVIEPVPALTIAVEPLAAADRESIPTWAGDPLNLDYVLSTLIQRRDARQQQRRQLERTRAAVMERAGAQAA